MQIRGCAQTSSAGLQIIEARSVQDRTLAKTFTVPPPGAAAPYSGSGRIRQLNYGPDGAINGFWLDNGTLATVPAFSATNPSSVRVGATITYAGYARNTLSDTTVVDVQTITINGQPLALGVARPGAGFAAAPAPPSEGGPGGPPPPPPGVRPGAAPPSSDAAAPPPPGRTDQPPPPPPPLS